MAFESRTAPDATSFWGGNKNFRMGIFFPGMVLLAGGKPRERNLWDLQPNECRTSRPSNFKQNVVGHRPFGFRNAPLEFPAQLDWAIHLDGVGQKTTRTLVGTRRSWEEAAVL